jgi:hypothetical protein
MKNKSDLIVSLTGGLGNQLFQYACGLAVAGDNDLYLCSAFGKPRKSSNGQIELLSFNLSHNTKLLKDKQALWLTRKFAGYILRIGIVPKKFEKNPIYIFLIKMLAKIVFTSYFRKKVSIFNNLGIGYSNIKKPKKRTLLFGYFQTFKWVNKPELKKSLMAMNLKISYPALEHYKNLSYLEKPLIVHVRLGDYMSEKNFGIPSKAYYELAIKTILNFGKCKTIWLFSDDLDVAKDYMPNNLNIPVRYFNQIENSTAATFETMRLGCGYVIANSTFSWWAAYLNNNLSTEVVSPKPWFSNMSEPIDLIPDNWIRIDAEF